MLNYGKLQSLGHQVGLDKVGVSAVQELEADHLTQWLDQGFHGQMTYMERNLEKRLDPGKLLVGARSVISVYVNYHHDKPNPDLDGVISKYARSVDYHPVVKDLLHELADGLFGPEIKALSRKQKARVYRVFVDSAPVMEKQWAIAAGIGWQGKHSNIITREYGSWGFLGEIITTEAFDRYNTKLPDLCGTCTACIDACPTQAIVAPYRVDGSKCISYATIELPAHESISNEVRANMGDWLFGCDICQDVCPWNRFAKPGRQAALKPVASMEKSIPDFHELGEQEFASLFGATPLERPGLSGMRRNQQKQCLS